MAKYSLSAKSVEDLSGIWNYTFDSWSEKQADYYYYMLLDTCQELADGHLAGKNYPEIDDEILGFRAGQHIIFYKKTRSPGILVIRFLHSRMDLKSRMQDSF